MKLVVFSFPYKIGDEIRVINELFENGMERFHVRKPDFNIKQFQAFLSEIPELYHNRIVIHSCYELCEKFQIKGIHLPEKTRHSMIVDNTLEEIRKYKIVSTSFHDLENLEANLEIFDYVFLSPVFDSISKINYFSAYNFRDVFNTLSQVQTEVIALGGVNLLNINQAYKMGFKGIAVLGAIWKNPNPVKAFKDVIECCREIERTIINGNKIS